MKPHASFTRNYIEGFMTQTRRIKSSGLNKYWKFSFSLDYYLEWLDDFIIGNNFKGTAKENWKGWKLITLALDPDPWKLYLMFLSREIDIKLCQILRKCIYIQFCIETVGLNRSYTPPIWHSFISISRDRNIRYNFQGSRSRAKVISFQPVLPFSKTFIIIIICRRVSNEHALPSFKTTQQFRSFSSTLLIFEDSQS